MKKLEELEISPEPWNDIAYKNEIVIAASGGFDDLSSALCRGKKRRANARLIAAAPKLYGKAWELLAAFDERVMTPEHIEALRAALAEAAGEEA